MSSPGDPQKKKQKVFAEGKGKAQKKAFQEGTADNSIREANSNTVTNVASRIVNSQEENIVVNKVDKNDD